MPTLRIYTLIYVVLFILATVQLIFERLGFSYIVATAGMMVVSTAKAVLVAGYYQHLKYEPRSIIYLYLFGLVTAMFLTAAAAYSIL